jgi:hypothetical protein
VIQTLAMQDDLDLDNWITQLNKSTKRIGKAKAKTVKGNKAGLAECPVYNDCQLCGGGGHNAKECKKFTFMKKEKTCYQCGKEGHIARNCPEKSAKKEYKEYQATKKAFKAASKRLKGKKIKKGKSSSSSSSEEGKSSSDSDSSDDSSSSGELCESGSSSSTVEANPPRRSLACKTRVTHGKKARAEMSWASQAEDDQGSDSDDSTLSWDEYNKKNMETRGISGWTGSK